MYAQIRAYAVHYCTIALNFEEVFNGQVLSYSCPRLPSETITISLEPYMVYYMYMCMYCRYRGD